MFTPNPLPNLKQLFFSKFDSEFCLEKTYKKNSNYSVFWTSRSLHSLVLLCDWFFNENKRAPVFLLPSYICYEVPEAIEQLGGQVLYYQIDENFLPILKDIDSLAQSGSPDFILAVHYFGLRQEASTVFQKIKKLSMARQIYFIEDWAHVIMPTENTPYFGDFCLFSPYKHFPIPNGGALVVSNNILQKHPSLLQKLLQIRINHKKPLVWVVKKTIQSICGLSRHKLPALHSHDPERESSFASQAKFSAQAISQLSLDILSAYKIKDLEQIIKVRIENAHRWQLVLNCLRDKYPTSSVVIEKIGQPYFYCIKMFDQVQLLYAELNKLSSFAQTWPTLPKAISESQSCEHATAKKLRQEMIFLPIHQGLYLVDFLRALKKIFDKKFSMEYVVKGKFSKFSLRQYQGSDLNWEEMHKSMRNSNILQSIYFSKARQQAFSENLLKFEVLHGEEVFGLLVARVKKIGPLKIVFINRGPILKNSSFIDYVRVLKLISRKFPIWALYVVIICPELENELIFTSFLKQKWMIRIPFVSHHSAKINLLQPLTQLRAQLDGKWRNLLKKAEASQLHIEISSEQSGYDLLLEQYKSFMQKKDFQGLPIHLLQEYFKLCEDNYKAIVLKASQGDQIISTVLIARYAQHAVYLVGINNDLGRSLCANYLLLWKAIEVLQSQGVVELDLGGFDDIKTPQITHFKRQMNGVEYKTIGSYILL